MRPFEFLDSTLQVLLVEDDQTSVCLINDLLAFIPVYAVESVSTCVTALKLLRSGRRFHVIILDLGIDDVENDEFYLLRHYASQCSIIVFTASESPQKGAQSVLLGARAVVEKNGLLDSFKLLKTVNNCALMNIVNRTYSEAGGSGTLWSATKVLLEKHPCSVTEWAEFMGITDRQLRNIWSSTPALGARNVLFLHKLFSSTFSYYECTNFSASSDRTLFEDSEYQKVEGYFQAHRQLFSQLVSSTENRK